MLWYATFLDSRFRGHDGNLAHLVIPGSFSHSRESGNPVDSPRLIVKLHR